MPRPIIIHIQPKQVVKLLTVIFIRLIRVLHTLTKQTSKRIIVINLLYRTALVYYHPVVTLMVFQKVVICWYCAGHSYIPFFRKYHAKRAVLVHFVTYILSLCNVASYLVSYA